MTEIMTVDRADYAARCFVLGMRRNGTNGKMVPASGEFSSRFMSHPWVRESITEGWARELRTHLILTVKMRAMVNRSYQNIEELMPPKDWVSEAKQKAAKDRAGLEWREATFGKINGEYFLRKLGICKPVDKFDQDGVIIE